MRKQYHLVVDGRSVFHEELKERIYYAVNEKIRKLSQTTCGEITYLITTDETNDHILREIVYLSTYDHTVLKIEEVTNQPPPVRNNTIPLYVAVMSDIEKRAEMGKRKYGTYLQAHNGRDALQDAYEEALDLCMYLKQLITENEDEI